MPVRTWSPGDIALPADLTPPIIAAITAYLSDAQVLGLTAWREAEARFEPGRGWIPNPIDALIDIMNVVDNRVRRSTNPRWIGASHRDVCLEHKAFSCWLPTGGPDDPHDGDALAENFETLMAEAQHLLAGHPVAPKLLACVESAEAFLEDRHEDLLTRSTHYYASWMKTPPYWAVGHRPVVERFGHRYFNDVR